MAKTKTVYRARSTFIPPTKLSRAPIVEGKDYEGDHPVVGRFPESFEKIRIETSDDGAVERATANPGEKRDLDE